MIWKRQPQDSSNGCRGDAKPQVGSAQSSSVEFSSAWAVDGDGHQPSLPDPKEASGQGPSRGSFLTHAGTASG